MSLKLIVTGHGGHGKGTACKILASDFGLTSESSSRFCSRLFIFDLLRDKYGYATEEECYVDRQNHRSEWFDAIEGFNCTDGARLGKAIFAEFDVYDGLRSDYEFSAMQWQGVFDYSLWVDRSQHVPFESNSSMRIREEWTDFTIDNNGDLCQLKAEVARVMALIQKAESSHANG